MIFSTPIFIFLFLPCILAVYYISPSKFKNTSLFLASLVFYAWGEPVYVSIMLFSTVFDYINGLSIEKFKSQKKYNKAKLVLIISIVGNLAILFFFKYSNFLISNINQLTTLNITPLDLKLPIGISFYTFQTMSYTIDVYRGEVKAQRNIIDFGTFVSLFPQLVAGPIVRYKTIAEQLKRRVSSINKFSEGVQRFIIGLAKKVLLANNIGMLWEQISNSDLTIASAWLGAICFSLQIYFDFSGYSDMAIGLGKMFGFDFLENFNLPYISKSITEFWRRWHISLGTWFKEYVYIPLGGSREGKKKLIINMLIVWALTGLWHGANWNFVFWGMYFGILLILEKLVFLKWLMRLPNFVQHFYTLFLVVVSWVIFAIDDTSKLKTYLQTMFGMGNVPIIDNQTIYLFCTNIFLIIICIVASTRLQTIINTKLMNFRHEGLIYTVKNICYITIFIVSICFLIGASYNPFLYFRF
ncbi:MBOAT family O-acyltransferase [Vallitalea maricola]|uniref:MBOAT family protein n=1 Tax=Vallitalea maricola TaxID=3074433 RepID=A0ACB5UIU3_9FIRM|nr:MBOAT family protein [Vallitalea sp. AN17-2]